MITFDLDFDVFDTIDLGKKRKAGDLFAINGEKHYNSLAAALRIYIRYLNGQLEEADNKISVIDIENALKDNPDIRLSVALAQKYYTKIFSVSIISACHYIFYKINSEDADSFIIKVLTGSEVNSTDPAYVLRQRMIDNSLSKAKLPQKYIIALTFKAWNAFRQGRIIKSLRYTTEKGASEEFPTPI